MNMSPRERWLAALKLHTVDRLPFWPMLHGRTACPDVCLVGGTNASLWTRSADEIVAEIERDLDSLPHHRGLVITSAGVMPPLCSPETIKKVCEAVKAYPLRI